MKQIRKLKNPFNNSEPNGGLEKPSSIGSRPEFYLIYLLFYFVPWFFYPPTTNDVIAAVIACGLFVVVYLHHTNKGTNPIPHILIFCAITYAVAPFHGSYGVFHIYASVTAAYLRPERKAWIWIISLTTVFALFSILTKQNIWDYIFVLVLAIPISIGNIYAAEREEREGMLERSRAHDQHQAALAERERIAQDIHDLLGQTLTMVTLKSEVASKLYESDPQRAKQELADIQAASRTALKEIREAVAGMNTTTVERELKRAEQVLTAADIKLKIIGSAPKLSQQANNSLGLAIREAITNIVRHSRASEAKLDLAEHEGSLTITVQDNGESLKIREGSGLRGLRRRVEKLGGKLFIKQEAGLELTMEVPIEGTAL